MSADFTGISLGEEMLSPVLLTVFLRVNPKQAFWMWEMRNPWHPVSCCPECSLITTCCSPQKGLNYKPGQDGLQEDNPANNIPAPAPVPAQEKHIELLTDIRNFVAFGGPVDGRASTLEIVAEFSERLPPGSSPLFKFMLSEVCEFHRMPSGEGVWKLCGDFRW